MLFHENHLQAEDSHELSSDDSHEISRLVIFEKATKFEIVVCCKL